MDHSTFLKFSEIIYERSGIKLGERKEALVSARIGKRMRELGIDEHKAYLKIIQDDTKGREIVQMLDVISTNVTSFFREGNHFDVLVSLFKAWRAAGQKRFRIWCAASSSGEEPYTIAMTLLNLPESEGCDIRILATDISTRILEKARQGRYSETKMAGVPLSMRDRFFARQEGEKGFCYQASDAMKSILVFQRLNLSKVPFPMRGPFDLIFCRNVMIYFDNVVRSALLAECHRLLRTDGYLFVGHAESLTGMMSNLKAIQPSIYVKKQDL